MYIRCPALWGWEHNRLEGVFPENALGDKDAESMDYVILVVP